MGKWKCTTGQDCVVLISARTAFFDSTWRLLGDPIHQWIRELNCGVKESFQSMPYSNSSCEEVSNNMTVLRFRISGLQQTALCCLKWHCNWEESLLNLHGVSSGSCLHHYPLISGKISKLGLAERSMARKIALNCTLQGLSVLRILFLLCTVSWDKPLCVKVLSLLYRVKQVRKKNTNTVY